MERQAIPIEVFYSYAHEDELLQKELGKHLIILERQEFITTWHSRKITAGTEWKHEVALYLNSADIILLLLSPDFMASDFCYDVEMKKALERHESGQARVIPIILRPVDWKGTTSLSRLQVLPKNGEPITSWPHRDGHDKAFLEVALGIRDVITALKDVKLDKTLKRAGPTPWVRTSDEPFAGKMLDHAIARLQANRASVYYTRRNYEEALAIYEQALLLNLNDTTALRGKADALQELQRYQEALVAYEQVLHLDSNDAAAYRGKGDVLRKLSRSWGALDAYGQALRLDPDDALAYRGKADAYMSLGFQDNEALVAYEQALRLDPGDALAYRGKADTLCRLRRDQEALVAYDETLRLNPNDSLAAQRKADLAEALAKRSRPRQLKTNEKQEDN